MPKAKVTSQTSKDASSKDHGVDLSYNEAHTALQLTLAALQARHRPKVVTGLGQRELLAAAGIVFGGAVVAEAALAFVGLGDPAVTSWGQMVAAGFAVLGLGWWVWLWPAAMLVMVSGLVAVAAESSEEGH